MTADARSNIIRGWILLVSIVGAWLSSPSLAIYLAPAVPLFFLCCCESCTCGFCDSSAAPCSLQVVLEGITDNTCTSCETFNGTFVLPQVGGGGGCEWRYEVDPAACGGSPESVRVLLFESFSNYTMFVEAISTVVFIRWTHGFGGTKPVCTSWSSFAVAWSSNSTLCASDHSDALVSAA